MTVEPQPAGPTFARERHVHDVRTYIYIYIYIYIIYIKNIYIYIYDENFSQLYDKCGARAARQLYRFITDYILENATALGLAYPAARSYNT